MGQKFHSMGGSRFRFKLSGDDTTTDELTVPVLVGQKKQQYPIIGFNVIEDVLSQHSENSQDVSNIIQQSFPSVHHTHVGAQVNLIQSKSQDTGSTAVEVGKRDVMLPKGEATKVKCQIHFGPVPEGMPMIFEPKKDSELPDGLEVWRISRVYRSKFRPPLCTLSEESLKEVCSGLKITLPPESKGRLVFIRALNKYLEMEELDYEKLKGLSSSLSTQEK